MATEKCNKQKLITAAIMLLTVLLLFLLNSFAGKQRGNPPETCPEQQILMSDNTVHLVLFNHEGSRGQLMKELYRLGLHSEMRLWHDFFLRIHAASRIKK